MSCGKREDSTTYLFKKRKEKKDIQLMGVDIEDDLISQDRNLVDIFEKVKPK